METIQGYHMYRFVDSAKVTEPELSNLIGQIKPSKVTEPSHASIYTNYRKYKMVGCIL